MSLDDRLRSVISQLLDSKRAATDDLDSGHFEKAESAFRDILEKAHTSMSAEQDMQPSPALAGTNLDDILNECQLNLSICLL